MAILFYIKEIDQNTNESVQITTQKLKTEQHEYKFIAIVQNSTFGHSNMNSYIAHTCTYNSYYTVQE